MKKKLTIVQFSNNKYWKIKVNLIKITTYNTIILYKYLFNKKKTK